MGMYNAEPIVDFGLSCSDESRTQQQFKDSCDVEKILKNYARTGDIVTGKQIGRASCRERV